MVISFILYGVNDGLVPRAPPSFPSFAVWKAMRSWMEDLCVIAHDVGSLDKQEFLLDPDCSRLFHASYQSTSLKSSGKEQV